MYKIKAASIMLLLAALVCPGIAQAVDYEQGPRALAIGSMVRDMAVPMNNFINSASPEQAVPAGADTRVLPVAGIGEDGYLGAVQVAGPADGVYRVNSVFQYQDNYDYGRYRISLVFPSSGADPSGFNRVQGVGVSAFIDAVKDGGEPGLVSGGIYTDDAYRAAAIGAAVTYEAEDLNYFINDTYILRKIGSVHEPYATKVVPRISAGQNLCVGGVQVVGPADQVNLVQAVFEFGQTFDYGRFQVNVEVPGDSLDPANFRRVYSVGISAVIDPALDALYPYQNYPYFSWYPARWDFGRDRYAHRFHSSFVDYGDFYFGRFGNDGSFGYNDYFGFHPYGDNRNHGGYWTGGHNWNGNGGNGQVAPPQGGGFVSIIWKHTDPPAQGGSFTKAVWADHSDVLQQNNAAAGAGTEGRSSQDSAHVVKTEGGGQSGGNKIEKSGGSNNSQKGSFGKSIYNSYQAGAPQASQPADSGAGSKSSGEASQGNTTKAEEHTAPADSGRKPDEQKSKPDSGASEGGGQPAPPPPPPAAKGGAFTKSVFNK